ncbi:MAG TPA: WbqC family protein [Usitatibacter sp.]|nr:WbqC family protein [Usitatibacter sp.]
MLIAIHQPHYIPWLGYLDRMAKADLFIVLDHVQFERRNFQNRTTIRLEGEPKLLTVPVVQLSQKETIIDKLVDNSEQGSRAWGPTHFKTLKYAYRKARFFDQYAPRLQEILEARWDKLLDLDLAMLDFARDAFDIRTPLKRSSEIAVEGSKSELLLNLCRAIGPGTSFLGGLGGSRRYLDHDAFAAANVGVQWQDFKHPTYPQCGDAPFIPGLMSLDALFNCGPAARELLSQSQETRDECLAA